MNPELAILLGLQAKDIAWKSLGEKVIICEKPTNVGNILNVKIAK